MLLVDAVDLPQRNLGLPLALRVQLHTAVLELLLVPLHELYLPQLQRATVLPILLARLASYPAADLELLLSNWMAVHVVQWVYVLALTLSLQPLEGIVLAGFLWREGEDKGFYSVEAFLGGREWDDGVDLERIRLLAGQFKLEEAVLRAVDGLVFLEIIAQRGVDVAAVGLPSPPLAVLVIILIHSTDIL
jgi:hypothetical protein